MTWQVLAALDLRRDDRTMPARTDTCHTTLNKMMAQTIDFHSTRPLAVPTRGVIVFVCHSGMRRQAQARNDGQSIAPKIQIPKPDQH
jgi:hypothetical protein